MNQEDEKKKDEEVKGAAKTLSSLGAKMGGETRALLLSPERRSEIARNAVLVRWEKSRSDEILPKVICGSPDRPLRISGLEIPCYVLEDEKRVLVISDNHYSRLTTIKIPVFRVHCSGSIGRRPEWFKIVKSGNSTC